MNQWKRIPAVLLVAAILCGSLPCQALAANTDAASPSATEADALLVSDEKAEAGSAAISECEVEPEETDSAGVSAETDANLVYDLDGLLVSDNGEEDMNSWRYEDGEPIEAETEDSNDGIMVVSTTSSDAVAFGIDVSKWQGTIDWESVRSEISFAIIRCGCGSNQTANDDAYFEQNVEACEELGIPYGVYLYSYATSTTEAQSEANHVLRLLEGHTPSLPVYLDLEDSSITSACTNAQILASTKVFCNAIEDAGYEAGIYANKNWWTNYLTSSTYDQWNRWVAQYNTSCTYDGTFSYWQYSSTGSVSGISGNVDCDYALSDAPFYNSSTPKIANAVLPSGNVSATALSISGIVSSSKTITNLTVNILNSDGETMQTSSVKPNGKSYELADMNFAVSAEALTGGISYTCQVTATTSDGTATVAESNFILAPVLTGVSAVYHGVKVEWAAYSGAERYRVYRKTNGGSWEALGDTTATSYTDTTAEGGNTYTYTVRAVTADGLSGYDATGKSIAFLSAPVISGLSNASTGVTVQWSAVSGASKYRVYRRTASASSWTKVADTTSTSYTDTTAVSNTTYYYTVRCVNSSGAGVSGYDNTGKSITYLSTPALKSAAAVASGIKVEWSAVDGGSCYRIYRKTNGGSWVKLADTTDTSYTDTTAAGGNTYTYTVRAIAADNGMSGYDATGKSIAFLSSPVISGLSNASTGVTVQWSAVSGASKYRVYRRTASASSWTKVADTTFISYTDTTAVSGTTYYYTVRCVNSSGTGVSGYDETGETIRYLAAPTLTGAAAASSGVKVTWTAVDGAECYRVYRKTNGGSWVKLADTTSADYTDTTAVGGNTYTYTVRALAGSDISSYDSTGKAITLLPTPVISSLSSTSGGVTVKWSAVSGASRYRVYRRTATSSWAKVADTTSTSYTDTTAVSGTTYYYTVRCINSSGTGVSGYDDTGTSVTVP